MPFFFGPPCFFLTRSSSKVKLPSQKSQAPIEEKKASWADTDVPEDKEEAPKNWADYGWDTDAAEAEGEPQPLFSDAQQRQIPKKKPQQQRDKPGPLVFQPPPPRKRFEPRVEPRRRWADPPARRNPVQIKRPPLPANVAPPSQKDIAPPPALKQPEEPSEDSEEERRLLAIKRQEIIERRDRELKEMRAREEKIQRERKRLEEEKWSRQKKKEQEPKKSMVIKVNPQHKQQQQQQQQVTPSKKKRNNRKKNNRKKKAEAAAAAAAAAKAEAKPPVPETPAWQKPEAAKKSLAEIQAEQAKGDDVVVAAGREPERQQKKSRSEKKKKKKQQQQKKSNNNKKKQPQHQQQPQQKQQHRQKHQQQLHNPIVMAGFEASMPAAAPESPQRPKKFLFERGADDAEDFQSLAAFGPVPTTTTTSTDDPWASPGPYTSLFPSTYLYGSSGGNTWSPAPQQQQSVQLFQPAPVATLNLPALVHSQEPEPEQKRPLLPPSGRKEDFGDFIKRAEFKPGNNNKPE